MRATRALITILLGVTLTTSPLRAEPPVDPNLPPPVSAPSSVQNFIELQKLTELFQQPDWLLAIGGIGIGFWGAQKLLASLVETVSSTVPAAARYYRMNRAYHAGERTLEALEKIPGEMQPLAILAKEKAEALKDFLKKLPKGIAHRKDLEGQTPSKIDELLKKDGMFEELRATKKGREWLAEYEAKKLEHDAAMGALMAKFTEATTKMTEFSQWANTISTGLLGTPELAHRELRYRVEHNANKGAGNITIFMDGGFLAEIDDPIEFPKFAHAPATKCADVMSKLGIARNKAKVAMQITTGLKPASRIGAIALGFGLYKLGASRIGKTHHGEAPEQILQKEKARAQASAQADALRDALRGSDLSATTKVIRELRRSGKRPEISELYAHFRKTMRAHLPKMADHVREKTDAETRAKSDFEKNTERFAKEDEWANGILDSALAEAALSEAKVGTPERVFDLLFSEEDTDQIQVAVLLGRHYSSAAKYLWRDLKIEGASYPVKGSQVAGQVNETLAALEDLKAKIRTDNKPKANLPAPAPAPGEKGSRVGALIPNEPAFEQEGPRDGGAKVEVVNANTR